MDHYLQATLVASYYFPPSLPYPRRRRGQRSVAAASADLLPPVVPLRAAPGHGRPRVHEASRLPDQVRGRLELAEAALRPGIHQEQESERWPPNG